MSDTLLTPRFHLIGTQLAAWRDNSGGTISTIKTDTGTSNVALSASADTGAFGSSMIAMASSTKIRAARYAGQNNWSDVAAFSVLMRIIPRWTGAPAASEQGFFYASSPWTSISEGVYLGMDTSGAVFVGYYDQFGTAYVSNVDFAATYTGFVSGTAVDLLFLWDGSSSANSVKFYVNGTLIASKTPAAGNPSVNNLNMGSVVFGMCPNGGTLSNFDLNEAAIWNYVLSASDITNLTNRSTFLATAAFDGTSYTDPGVSNVKTGTSYTQAGVAEVGTYDGSDRWTDPGIANVRNATAYKANSTSNNRTGTAAIPVAGDVRSGVSTDATTGTCVVPSTANTKTGISVDVAGTGTYDGSDRWTDPGIANVRNATAYKANSTTNNRTGNVVVPTASQVQTGVTFESSSGTTGIYDGSDRWSDPGISNVRSLTAYKANSTSNNRTGNVVVPTVSQVKVGTAFETSGGSTGIYDGSDRWTDPGAANVKHGVLYQANSTVNNQTGTYTGTDEFSDPGIQNVLAGVSYLSNGNSVVGTLQQVFNYMKQLLLRQNPAVGQALVMTQGDHLTFNFQAIDDTNSPFDLTGATFSSQMMNTDGTLVTWDNSAHAANSDQVSHKGEFTLFVTSTSDLAVGESRTIITTVSVNADIIQFRGTMTVLSSRITR